MNTIKSDPLLAIAKGIIYFMMGVMAVGGIAVAIAAPALLVFYQKAMSQIAEAGAPPATYWLIIVLLVVVAGLIYLGFRFFRHMLHIAQSVGEGDPFVPANADRLNAMAWIMLTITLASIPVTALGAYITKLAGEDTAQIDVGFDGGGIVLILTLFVLARVFRKGTEMRADLEGTV
ncbi:hypothetical protein AMC99_02803 [Altererythrobacter epoxidivorans]|uniref:DUF2975 domain-containing protein n=1 Tax=Altererythrobacter epoxidivorans TaxID=361183 RepID=A0A0M5KZ73_9SPHN|nr:DUF2975 domain-containing protein [Altererythrobacter epoxidivorans]ALE18074.1 hypothetical protein AMC99_02803 [Altererythrobacter epoxidivorans]